MGPWEKYGGTSAAPAAAPVAGPMVIGQPREKPLPPQRPVEAALDAQQLENARLEAEAKRLANEKARAEAAAGGPAAKATEGAKAAEGFYKRAKNAHDAYGAGVAPRGVVADALTDVLPKTVVNKFASDERRNADTYAAEFVAATLRKESGAAISPAEFESQYGRYFPQPGDGPEQIAIKQQLRETALEAIRVQTGGLIPESGPAAHPRLSDEQLQAEVARLIRSGDRQGVMALLDSQGAKIPDAAQLDAAIDAGAADVSVKEEPGVIDQLRGAAQNTIAGIGQGLAAIPDAFVNAAGGTMQYGAELLGQDWLAQQLANRVTIGGMIEKAVPTPDTAVDQGVRLTSQVLGGVGGAPARATNALVGSLVGKVPVRPTAGNALSPGQEVMGAADRLSASTGVAVQPLAADVGGAMTRRATSAGAQLPFSAGPIVKGGQRVLDQTQAARDVVASRAGRAVQPEEAGEAVLSGAKAFRATTSAQARSLYNRAQKAAEGVTIQPQSLLQTIGNHVRDQRAVPGGTDATPVLQKLQEALAQAGGISVEGMRGLRTTLRSRLLDANLTPTDAQRIVDDVVKAAGDDITNSLKAAGRPDAAKAYAAADKFWAERMATMNEAIKPIIGKAGEKDAGQVFQAIQQLSKGNATRLGKLVRALPAEDASTVRATIIGQLGKSSPGTQGAEGASFSLGQFLTHWNQLTPRAKQVLFDGQTLRDLNDLAKVAEGSKRAMTYANTSNTGGVVGALATGGTLALDFTTLAGTAIAQFGGGRLLASPGFARWLARAPKRPEGFKSHIGRLSAVATQNPAVADEIGAVQRAMMNAANENVAQVPRLAASPLENEEN